MTDKNTEKINKAKKNKKYIKSLFKDSWYSSELLLPPLKCCNLESSLVDWYLDGQMIQSKTGCQAQPNQNIIWQADFDPAWNMEWNPIPGLAVDFTTLRLAYCHTLGWTNVPSNLFWAQYLDFQSVQTPTYYSLDHLS